VKIAQNDVMIPTACITADGYALDADEDGAIYVYIPEIEKLVDADKNKSVIYLPLPVWNKQVDIVISFPTPETASLYEGQDKGGKAEGVLWKEYKTLKNKTIVKGKVYGNKDEYNLALDGTTPEAITDALEMIETDEETIVLKANNPITVCAAGNNTVIEIPNKEGVKIIILDLSKGLDGCTGGETLKIVYKDSGDKFQGNVMLITSDAGSYTVNLDVDLDESGFGIANGKALDKMDIDAAEFVIGDGTIATDLKYANITLSDNVTALTVAEKGKIDEITIDDSKFKNVATVTVNGEVTGAIDATNKVVNITVEGDDAVVGVSSGDIKAKGSVDISSKKAFAGAITADGSITVTSEATINGAIESKESTVSLSGKATASAAVTAKGNISIIEEANATAGDITSSEGDITISNTKGFTYTGLDCFSAGLPDERTC